MRVCVSSWDIIAPATERSLETLHTKALPASARRRLGVFGQLAGSLSVDKVSDNTLIVFASRYGDEKRSLQILEEICEGEPLSPMNFSLSVHNAVPGVLSIAWKLKEMQSIIAAGVDSFAMGLTEAFSLITAFPEKSILLIYVDIPLPEMFSAFEDKNKNTGACALLLKQFSDETESVQIEASMETSLASPDTFIEDHFTNLQRLLQGTIPQTKIEANHFNWQLERVDG